MCANSISAVLPNSYNTAGSVLEAHGASKQEFTVCSQFQEPPFSLQWGERAWKRLQDRKVNSLCLLQPMEQIRQIYRESFTINSFLLQGRKDGAGPLADNIDSCICSGSLSTEADLAKLKLCWKTDIWRFLISHSIHQCVHHWTYSPTNTIFYMCCDYRTWSDLRLHRN